jgi:hypothetical protein
MSSRMIYAVGEVAMRGIDNLVTIYDHTLELSRYFVCLVIARRYWLRFSSGLTVTILGSAENNEIEIKRRERDSMTAENEIKMLLLGTVRRVREGVFLLQSTNHRELFVEHSHSCVIVDCSQANGIYLPWRVYQTG